MKNQNLITQNQTTNIEEWATRTVASADLSMDGSSSIIDSDEGGSAVVTNKDAVRNVVLFWLASERADYTRTEKGGPLSSLVGKRLTQEVGADLATHIKNSFQLTFPDLQVEIFNIQVTPDPVRRLWIVSIDLFDTIAKELSQLNVAVEA